MEVTMKIELTSKVAGPDTAVLMYEAGKAALGVPVEAGKALAGLAAKEGFSGKDKELVLLHPCAGQPGARVLLAGLGARRKCGLETIRQRVAAIVRRARDAKITALDILLPGPKELPVEYPAAIMAVAEAVQLTGYKFEKYKAP